MKKLSRQLRLNLGLQLHHRFLLRQRQPLAIRVIVPLQKYEAIKGTVAKADSSDVILGPKRSDKAPAHFEIISIGNAKPVRDKVISIVPAPKLLRWGAHKGSKTPIE